MNGNITTAPLGGNRNIKTKPLFQYDYGQVLKIVGVTLPAAYEVHFSNQLHGVATTQIGNADGVIIPDIYLTTGEPVYAWIYLHTGNSDGETEYTITIPVVRRASISDAEPTPVQQDVITQAIAALNTAVEQTAQDVQDATEAKEDAEEAAGNAYESAVAAAQSAANANTSAGQAQTAQAAAELAQQKAEEAQLDAQAAQWAAESAQTAAEAAQAGAVAARTGAETAQAWAVAARSGAEAAQHAAEAARDEITGLSATANTLPAGSQATASYSDGLLTIGVPKGEKGDTGDTGATPDLTIGTVQTLPAGSSATASITGTAEDPVLNLGIPKGDQGEVSQAEFDALADDVSDMQDTLEHKADIDGYYTDMTVGAAEQVVSSTMVEDNAPYKFRTSGGSTDIGNRAYVDKVVGGTVAWNQLVKNGDFGDGLASWTTITGSQYQTQVANNGICTVTCLSNNSSIGIGNDQSAVPALIGHKILFSVIVNPSGATKIRFGGPSVGAGNYGVASISVPANVWTNATTIGTVASGNTTTRLLVYVNAGSELAGNDTVQLKNITAFDLTQMFGATIADYIYSLEQANAGAGVAYFRKLFPAPYYAYNAGELISVQGLQSRDVVGFNQLDEATAFGALGSITKDGDHWTGTIAKWINGTTGTGNPMWSNIRYLDKTAYYCAAKVRLSASGTTNVKIRVSYTDGTSEESGIGAIVTQGNTGVTYLRTNGEKTVNNISFTYGTGTSGVLDVYWMNINLSHNASRNGEYQPYEKRSYPLDSTLTLRGIPKVEADGVYWDGDRYLPDGTVERRYGVVDLGTLDWGYHNTQNFFYANIATLSVTTQNLIANDYVYVDKSWAGMVNGEFGKVGNQNQVRFHNDAYTNAAAFKAAMSGVYLIYELATPTTETAAPYQHIQSVDDWGTEEFVSSTITPVGHSTRFPQNLRDKLQHLPALASSNGSYIITQTNGQMVLSPFPTPPTAAGNYLLKATVSGGNATYSWVAQ